MAQRITEKKLQLSVDRLNRLTSNHLCPFTTSVNALGVKVMTANVGTYVLSYAYGGVCLNQIDNESHGVRSIISGYQTKRDLYYRLSAFIFGVELRNYCDWNNS